MLPTPEPSELLMPPFGLAVLAVLDLLVNARRCDRLAPMEKRLSLWCPLCDVLVAGFGRRQTIGQMAQHLAVEHPQLTEAQRDALARRAWRPLPLTEALMAVPPPAD